MIIAYISVLILALILISLGVLCIVHRKKLELLYGLFSRAVCAGLIVLGICYAAWPIYNIAKNSIEARSAQKQSIELQAELDSQLLAGTVQTDTYKKIEDFNKKLEKVKENGEFSFNEWEAVSVIEFPETIVIDTNKQ